MLEPCLLQTCFHVADNVERRRKDIQDVRDSAPSNHCQVSRGSRRGTSRLAARREPHVCRTVRNGGLAHGGGRPTTKPVIDILNSEIPFDIKHSF